MFSSSSASACNACKSKPRAGHCCRGRGFIPSTLRTLVARLALRRAAVRGPVRPCARPGPVRQAAVDQMVKAERGLQAVKCIVRSRKDRCEHLWRSVFIKLICASSSCHSTGATSLGRTNLPSRPLRQCGSGGRSGRAGPPESDGAVNGTPPSCPPCSDSCLRCRVELSTSERRLTRPPIIPGPVDRGSDRLACTERDLTIL